MAVTEATNLGLAAFASNAREEANMLAGMAKPFVVVVGTFFVELIEAIWRQVDLTR